MVMRFSCNGKDISLISIENPSSKPLYIGVGCGIIYTNLTKNTFPSIVGQKNLLKKALSIPKNLVSNSREYLYKFLPESIYQLAHLILRFPNSLTVKWDAPAGMTNFNSHRYRLSIESENIGYSAEYFLPGDKSTFVFSKLSDGEHFDVKVEYCVTPCKSDTEVICSIYNLFWEML